jgi:hypothetical protein
VTASSAASSGAPGEHVALDVRHLVDERDPPDVRAPEVAVVVAFGVDDADVDARREDPDIACDDGVEHLVPDAPSRNGALCLRGGDGGLERPFALHDRYALGLT